MLAIEDVAAKLGLRAADLIRFGHYQAKLQGTVALNPPPAKGRLILVTAVSPTTKGEGKTITSIALGDALSALGKKTAIALREPSLGPLFGRKGGAVGGGAAQLWPPEDISLHFTGDIHALTAAHNLLASLVWDDIFFKRSRLLPSAVSFGYAMDINARSLRHIRLSAGGRPSEATERSGFCITAASELMAILCLADHHGDLRRRMGRIIVGREATGGYVTAEEVGGLDAVCGLLQQALLPNLVQSGHGTPVLIHGGPFANIAHGCSSLIATRLALGLADYVVTEAGFGADLGAEKFVNIKAYQGGLEIACSVIVATLRALKEHGGAAQPEKPDTGAVERGFANLRRHMENMRAFGCPTVVALNAFDGDSEGEKSLLEALIRKEGMEVYRTAPFTEGAGASMDLARAVVHLAAPTTPRYSYESAMSLREKIEALATKIYRADSVVYTPAAAEKIEQATTGGYGGLRVCMAKTPFSFTADPAAKGAPEGFALRVTDVILRAGAGFATVLCGQTLTMPGLPAHPRAFDVHLRPDGSMENLL